MKVIISALLIGTFPIFSFAQFKTEYNANGDPLSEIVDESEMRQGDWNFYNNNDQLIRSEVYKNNQLVSRIHYTGSGEINTVGFLELQLEPAIELSVEVKEIVEKCSGEIVLNKAGDIVLIEFYDIHTEEDKSTLAKFMKEATVGQNNCILQF